MSNKQEITYRNLTIEECHRIAEIDPSQWIEKVWRKVDSEYKLIKIDYMEESWPDGLEKYRDGLVDTFKNGGAAFGAFDEKGTLIGYGSINRDFFGQTAKHVLLDSLFVSRAYRGFGIGKHLVKLCGECAKEWGADKLYACAGSSEDTIAFYKSLGWIEAQEINKEMVEADERDIQLEFRLSEGSALLHGRRKQCR